MDLIRHIDDSIQGRGLLGRGEKMLVAVSGGLDSMVLLQALTALSAKHRWKPVVAHFNHQLRGRAADADEQLVRRSAKAMGWPAMFGRADVKQFAQRSKWSVEMAGRKLRHEFFARVAREQKIRTIVLAHHADDQVELFFLRLFRGAGSQGLSGMKWRSASPVDPRTSLIRPLLDLSRQQLREHARSEKISFREDATNQCTDFLRNRIRHELLPLLQKDYQPAIAKMILRTMDIIGAESELVSDVSQELSSASKPLGYRLSTIGYSKTGAAPAFAAWPVAIQRRTLQARLMAAGIAADFESIETLRRSADTPVTVGPNLSLSRDADGKVVWHPRVVPGFSEARQGVNLDRSGKTVFGGAEIKWSAVAKAKSPAGPGREFFDADKIGDEVVLRHWQPGDRFRPIGLGSAAKLQDLFVNAKVPREQRHRRIVATTSAGEIFWVEGLRIGDAFKLGAGTKRRLQWAWRRNLC